VDVGEGVVMTTQTEQTDTAVRSDALPEALHSYLHNIGRTPLLTAEQEVALAQQIEQGDPTAVTTLVEHRPALPGPRPPLRGSDRGGQLWLVGRREEV